jgi:hypothetical protein
VRPHRHAEQEERHRKQQEHQPVLGKRLAAP